MSEHRKKADWPIIAGVILALVVVVALGVYLWECFGLCRFYDARVIGFHTLDTPTPAVRLYKRNWQAKLYYPAARVESLTRGAEVKAVWSIREYPQYQQGSGP